jgi:hypothetical protein
MTLRITTELAWGDADGETLDDVLETISDRVPSARLHERTDLDGAGGWPVYDIEFADEDLDSVASVFELSIEEFVAAYAVDVAGSAWGD